VFGVVWVYPVKRYCNCIFCLHRRQALWNRKMRVLYGQDGLTYQRFKRALTKCQSGNGNVPRKVGTVRARNVARKSSGGSRSLI